MGKLQYLTLSSPFILHPLSLYLKNMDAKELEKMTILQLRAEALKFPDIQGVHGMKKEDLLKVLREKYGIKDEGPKGDIGYKRQLKAKIKQFKDERAQALQTKDTTKAELLRKRIKQLKRKTRKIAEQAKAAAARGISKG